MDTDIEHERARIESLNMAIKFNTKLLAGDSLSHVPATSHSISEIGRILKKKNEHYQTENQQKQYYNTDLSYHSTHKGSVPKALQVNNLIKVVKSTTREYVIRKSDNKTKKEQSEKLNHQFWFEQLDEHNQGNYLVGHSEYFVKKVIGETFKKRKSKQERTMKKQTFNAIQNIADVLIRQPELQSKPKRVTSHRQIYLNFIKNIITNDIQINSVDEFIEVGCGDLWEILDLQMKNYYFHRKQGKDNPQLSIVLTSLELVEDIFKKNLPDNENDLSIVIERSYVDKGRNYFKDNKKELRWGIAYFYYKAGLLSKFYSKISEDGEHGSKMRRAFERLHHSIDRNWPNPQQFTQKNLSDPFYHQLIYLLRGQMRISSMSHCQPNSLDFVWLTLRLSKIFFHSHKNMQTQNGYDRLLKVLEKHLSENQEQLNKIDTFKNLFYLNAFEVIINLYDNQFSQEILKQEDYLHLLIVLYYHPYLLEPGTKDVNRLSLLVSDQLNKVLMKFISSHLMNCLQEIEYSVYYMLLIPEKYIKQSFPQMFNKLGRFDKIDRLSIDGISGWEFIEFKMFQRGHEKIYVEAMQKVFDKMLQNSRDFQTSFKLIERADKLFSKHDSCQQYFQEYFFKTTYKSMNSQLREQLQTTRNFIQKRDESKNRLNKFIDYIRKAKEDKEILKRPHINFIQKYFKLEKVIQEKNIHQQILFIQHENIIHYLENIASEVEGEIPGVDELIDVIVMLDRFGCIALFKKYVENYVNIVAEVKFKKGNYVGSDQYRQQMERMMKQLNVKMLARYQNRREKSKKQKFEPY